MHTHAQSRTHNTHTKHTHTLEWGSESGWRWSAAKPAGSLTIFIFIIHTLIGPDRTNTHSYNNTHTS